MEHNRTVPLCLLPLCLLRYFGEYQDLCSGLIYLRNRYYDPSIGRFISEDPIRDGLNWYVYCHSDPINFFDMFGLEENRDKEVLTPDDYDKILMFTAIYNYAKFSMDDLAIADEAHRNAIEIRQQSKYSGIDGYGPISIPVTYGYVQFSKINGAVDKYDYTKSSANVTIKIGEPLSLDDVEFETGEIIDSNIRKNQIHLL